MSQHKSDILISVDDRHVQNMLDGYKRVEFRRRSVSVGEGVRVWIYSKIPTGEVKALGIVEQVFRATPADIWKYYGDVSGISKTEFDEYYTDVEEGCAIVFHSIEELTNKISLSAIRNAIGQFHPPQFFKYLSSGSPELELFETYNSPSSILN